MNREVHVRFRERLGGRFPGATRLHEGLLRLAVWRWRSLCPVHRPRHVTLDIDGLPIEVFGHQGGSAYHGYAKARIYSPLIASLAETGDMVGGLLREGNAGTAEEADTWIPHLVQRLAEGLNLETDQVQVRLDAGFTDGETLTAMDSREIAYLGRLKSNSVLQAKAEPYLTRPPGRPPETPREWCHDLTYQADSWESPRRVVLVVQETPDDLLFHAFFLVTNLNKLDYPPEKVLALYRKRGKAEAHMGELKSALNVHLSSTDRGDSTVQQVMARNQVSLLLSLYPALFMTGKPNENLFDENHAITSHREAVVRFTKWVKAHRLSKNILMH